MKPVLYQLSYSPWSEKATWALDACGVVYQKKGFTPVLGAPWVKVRAAGFRHKLTIPLLKTKSGTFRSSEEIARWADHTGKVDVDLFPPEHAALMREVIELSETALAHGRALSSIQVLDNPPAMREVTPEWIPNVLRPAVAKFGVRQLKSKYGFSMSRADNMAGLREALQSIQSYIQPQTTLLDRFSFADIAAATAFYFVKPPADKWMQIKPHFRESLILEELIEAFAESLKWRDWLYDNYRYNAQV